MMIENYRHFIGKICTILTNPISFPFRDGMQHAQFFSGLVTEVNDYGIHVKHLHTPTMAFFAFPIVGIVEEPVITKDDPNYEKVKAEMERKKAPPVKAVPNAPKHNIAISVEEMTRLAKEIKKKC